jgi:hypothetical protein
MGRDLKRTIIVDNSPASYALQPTNAIHIESWFDDPEDRELYRLVSFLKEVKDCRDFPRMLYMKFANDPLKYWETPGSSDAAQLGLLDTHLTISPGISPRHQDST